MGSRKKQMAEAIKAEKKQVAFAKLNNCPTSPRKMRLVADLVRGEKAEKALQILRFSPKEASRRLEKLVCLQLQTGKLKTKMQMLRKQILYIKRLELMAEQC